MRIRQETILLPVQSGFKAIKYTVPFFNMEYHFHEEFELVYITQGSGTRYIGDTVQKFSSGDMMFIGPGLAHIWISPGKYRHADSTLKVEAIVLQFPPDLLGSLLTAPEFAQISQLLGESQYGLRIRGETRDRVVELLEALLDLQGVQRLVSLLTILDILSSSRNIQRVNTTRIPVPQGPLDTRINRIQNFVMSCFAQNISSRDAASLANLEHSAFCRFFKGRTGKTFTAYLNETRIDQVCQRLLQQQMNVTQAAFECGFSNLSHFYRQFRKIVGMTPRAYLQD